MLTKEKRENLVRAAQLSALGLSQKKIGAKLSKPHKQPAVAKLLQEAKLCGIIRTEIDPDAVFTGEPDLELSDQLRKAFSLETARVLEVPADFDTDELHIALANATALSVRESLKSFDYIAVAGGRAVARLCEVLGQRPVNVHDVAVTPLGGRLWNGHIWKGGARLSRHLEQPLNPDDCALRLARSLHSGHQPEIAFTQVGHPLYTKSQDAAEEIIDQNCAFTRGGGWDKFGLGTPSVAFVGVGMLSTATSHRLAEWIDSVSKKSKPTETEKLLGRIDGAMKAAADGGLPAFGDVANRLFVCLPLPAELRSSEKRRQQLSREIKKLDGILLEVNLRSVVMDWNHLRSIKYTSAIAGGTPAAPKLHALWTLMLATALFDKGRIGLINSLTTDAQTAERLVEARQELAQSGADVINWYKDMLQILFPL